MKTIEEYLKLPYKMEITPDTEEPGYTVSFPELPGCLTCGDTLEEALANAEDAKRAWLTACLEDHLPIPEPRQYSGIFKIRMPKNLHRTLMEHAKEQGVSMNQYCVYLLTRNDGLHV